MGGRTGQGSGDAALALALAGIAFATFWNMEHRWGSRQPGGQRGHLHAQDGLVCGATVVDLSISGALLEVSVRPPVLARVRLRIVEYPDLMPIDAQVVRHTPKGCAIEWRELADPTVISLLRAANRVVEPGEETHARHGSDSARVARESR